MKKLLDNLGKGISDAMDSVSDAVRRQREATRARNQLIAEEIGLNADLRGRFHGVLDGVSLVRWSEDQGGKNNTDYWTITEFELAVDLPAQLSVRQKNLLDGLSRALGGPPDIELGIAELDRKLHITAYKDQADAVRRLLTSPAVLDRIQAVMASEMRWRLVHGKLRLAFRGRHKKVGPRGLRLGVETVHAINAALREPWAAVARDLGAHYDLQAAAPMLQGHHEGVPIRVQLVHHKQRTLTWVIGWFEPHLPEGTEVVHRNHLPKGLEVGDGILDKMLRVETTNLDRLRDRLATDAVRGPLLEVVHGHPRSSVRHDRVMLRLRGRAGPCLPERVALVVELAKALSS